jgi:hypothetical protein
MNSSNGREANKTGLQVINWGFSCNPVVLCSPGKVLDVCPFEGGVGAEPQLVWKVSHQT